MSAELEPVFGERIPGVRYVPRPCAYAVVRKNDGRIVVVEAPRGLFLPGGGIEQGEDAAEAVRRETKEECGLDVDVGRLIASAMELTFSAEHEAGFEKVSIFFEATVVGVSRSTEPGHRMLLLPIDEAMAALTPASHRYAVERWASRDR